MGKHQSKILQHLGVVAGVCDEIHLAELIDARIVQPRRKVSVGQAVKAMILNALGFSGRALYLNPRFYENRPVEVLIDEGLQAWVPVCSCIQFLWGRSRISCGISGFRT